MSVTEACFALTRSIQAGSERNAIKELYRRLEPQFGYHRRKYIVQFLSYLLVDSRRGGWEGSLRTPTLPISSEERLTLARAHSELVALNKACLAPIVDAYPGITRAVDPYSELPTAVVDDSDEVGLLPHAQRQTLTEAFISSPAVREALEGLAGVGKRMSVEQQVSGAHTMLTEVTKAGVSKAPERVSAIGLGTPPSSIDRQVLQSNPRIHRL